MISLGANVTKMGGRPKQAQRKKKQQHAKRDIKPYGYGYDYARIDTLQAR
jgi:hypothetical protein